MFDDANLERALDAVVFMIYSLNGERCTSSSRLLVQDSIADAFEARLIERVKAITIGHPLDPATEVGPLIDKTHFAKVTGAFAAARAAGATVAAGGARHGQIGYFVAPTLLTRARNDMTIANDTRYGLAGYIWSGDVTRALRVADQLEAGMIWINSENVRHLPTPFGGVKASGIGRDGGDWSFEFYMEQKHIGLATGTHAIPRLGVADP